MRLSFTVLLFSAFFMVGAAQAQDSSHILNAFPKFAKLAPSPNTNQLFFITRNSIDKKVVGSPYLFDWKEAFLVSNEDEIFSVRARYRVFDDEFQIMLNGKVKAVYPQMVKGIIFKDRAFIPSKFEVNDRIAYSFFELLSEGNICLLKRYGMSVKNTKDDFLKVNSNKSDFYYKYNNEENALDKAELLPLKQKDILQALGEYKEEVLSYVNKSRVQYNTEIGIKKIFDYYNSIQE